VHHTSHVLEARGSQRVLVRRQSNESSEHALLCWVIADEIRKHGGKPEVSATVDADVSVKIGRKTVCFEVETGENMECLGAEHVKEKRGRLKKEYDRVIVVVTRIELKARYARASGAEVIIRTEVAATVAGLFA
jgi:hypothetical protein